MEKEEKGNFVKVRENGIPEGGMGEKWNIFRKWENGGRRRIEDS